MLPWQKFICIADASKQVDILGKFRCLPVEVIPMARSASRSSTGEAGRASGLPSENVVTDQRQRDSGCLWGWKSLIPSRWKKRH
ncbi:ribose-5-phosphate isomerase A [Salmonella enterica subsp. enterica]|nr:ribose-5-phosphate isomerase A [Salmonella enterica subsp. enterica]